MRLLIIVGSRMKCKIAADIADYGCSDISGY